MPALLSREAKTHGSLRRYYVGLIAYSVFGYLSYSFGFYSYGRCPQHLFLLAFQLDALFAPGSYASIMFSSPCRTVKYRGTGKASAGTILVLRQKTHRDILLSLA